MTRTTASLAATVFLAAGSVEASLFQGTFGEFNIKNLSGDVPTLGEGQEVGGPSVLSAGTRYDQLADTLAQSHPEIPQAAVRKVFAYLKKNPASNMRYVTIIDMDKPSDEKRMYVISLRDGHVDRYLVAHGAGSGRGDTAERFSDRPRSHQTSLGIYVTGSEYDGKHGRSLTLDGKEGSNDNAEDRAVVLHGADYVSDEYARRNGRVGNSWGCPAVDHRYRDEIIDKIGNGSVMLIYAT